MKQRLSTFHPCLKTLAITFILSLQPGYAGSQLRLVSDAGAETISYPVGNETSSAFLCRPKGNSPFPAVIYNHGGVVDRDGFIGASQKGFDLPGICEALADDGFLAFVPIRISGTKYMGRHAQEVSRAIDFVRTLPEADPSRIALMGLSRGGLLTLMVGVKRRDLNSLVIQAPAPGQGHFERAVQQVADLDVPVLLLVEASDDDYILKNFALLKEALQEHNKDVRAILYDRGGGHELFLKVDYYWEDVRNFLTETLVKANTTEQTPRSGQTEIPAAGKLPLSTPRGEIIGPLGLTAAQVISNRDQDGDARISRAEFPGPSQVFARIDSDEDGMLTREELEVFWRSRGTGKPGG